jgi:hypothetical protein
LDVDVVIVNKKNRKRGAFRTWSYFQKPNSFLPSSPFFFDRPADKMFELFPHKLLNSR